MANNIAIKDGAGSPKTVATTDNGGVHTPHHRDPEAIAAIGLVGTRSYGAGSRISVGSSSSQSSAVTATEVLLHASTKCYVKAGSDPTAVADGDSIPLEAGEKFHMRITSGHKIAVIRDSADGYLHIVPVA
jgi:hypothetical protein